MVDGNRSQADEESYMSPEKCEEARQEGNELFKQGKYPEAIAKCVRLDLTNENHLSRLSYHGSCGTERRGCDAKSFRHAICVTL